MGGASGESIFVEAEYEIDRCEVSTPARVGPGPPGVPAWTGSLRQLELLVGELRHDVNRGENAVTSKRCHARCNTVTRSTCDSDPDRSYQYVYQRFPAHRNKQNKHGDVSVKWGRGHRAA